MRTIQMDIDEDLLGEADRAARRAGLNRSALLRQALREYLARLKVREEERRDREGYERSSDTSPELSGWERIAVWPDN